MIIHLEALPVTVRLGYYAPEREIPQDVIADIKVYLQDNLSVGKKDDIRLTVDYGRIIRVIDRALEDRSQEIKLVETVVEKIGSAIMAEFVLVDKVEVKVLKQVLPQQLARGAKISVSKTFSR